MPNHLHGIIVVCVGEGPCALPTAPRGRPYPGIENGQARGPVPTGCLSLSDVIERFKSLTTTRHIEGVKNTGWLSFPGQHPFFGSGVSYIMPNPMRGETVNCEVGAAPRGRPILGIENGRAQGPAPTG